MGLACGDTSYDNSQLSRVETLIDLRHVDIHLHVAHVVKFYSGGGQWKRKSSDFERLLRVQVKEKTRYQNAPYVIAPSPSTPHSLLVNYSFLRVMEGNSQLPPGSMDSITLGQLRSMVNSQPKAKVSVEVMNITTQS